MISYASRQAVRPVLRGTDRQIGMYARQDLKQADRNVDIDRQAGRQADRQAGRQ